jgi:hypothetical protein
VSPTAGPDLSVVDVIRGEGVGAFDRTFLLACRRVRQVCLDSRLIPMMTRALHHLPVASGVSVPHLTVICTIASADAVAALGAERHWTHSQVRADATQLLDIDGRIGVHAVTDLAIARDFEVGTPMRQLLHWWAAANGRCLVHAAAVGVASGGVLLAGAGGSGKSSTAAACLGSSLRVAGDDIVLIEPGGAPRAHSIYSSLKLDLPSVQRLSYVGGVALATKSQPEPGEKLVLLPGLRHPEQLIADIPLRAIVLLRITQRARSHITPAAPNEALMALAPSSLFLLRGHEARVFRHLVALVRTLPAVTLELGQDVDQIPRLLESIIGNPP